MRKPCVHFALRGSLALIAMQLLSPISFAAFANLSDWVGVDNAVGGNNYSVTSQTSAGGTFAERRLVAASLSDQSLVGGPFDWNTPLSMTGTVQFSNVFDPVMFFGWYDSANLNERIGLGVANPVPAGGGIRWQTQSGNVAGTGVVSQNLGANTTVSTFAPGTYAFTFNYNGLGNMTGTFGSLAWARNYAAPTNQDLNMNRFGFLQKSTSDNGATYTLNISNVNYTGESRVPEPSALVLAACVVPIAASIRRKTAGRR